MKKIPESLVREGHPDYRRLDPICHDILQRAGGIDALRAEFPGLLRECIDAVIETPKTGRRSYEELEKTEKTYIGTRVEIMLRAKLNLPRGRLDARIGDEDVDIKHTMGNNWMIPTEAVGHICILVAADETKSKCYLGLFVAKSEYLTEGANKDSKKSLSARGFSHILWILNGAVYPPNFWQTLPPKTVEEIFAGKSGNDRVVSLFRSVQKIAISRDLIDAVARQKDFTRRIRSDGRRGTRDRLAEEGIVLLCGTFNDQRELIRRFGLKINDPSDYVSYRLTTDDERAAARKAGFKV